MSVWTEQDQQDLDDFEKLLLEMHQGRERPLYDAIDPNLALLVAYLRRKKKGLPDIKPTRGAWRGGEDNSST